MMLRYPTGAVEEFHGHSQMAKRTATKKRWGDCTEEEDIDLEYPQWMLYMGVVPEGGIEDKALGSIGDNTSAAKQAK